MTQSVWWLILCVNLTRQGVPRYLVKHYSGCVCRAFWDEINMWISKLSKADCSSYMGWPHLISWGLEKNKKAKSPTSTVMSHLPVGVHSEKCIIRWVSCRVNIIECNISLCLPQASGEGSVGRGGHSKSILDGHFGDVLLPDDIRAFKWFIRKGNIP